MAEPSAFRLFPLRWGAEFTGSSEVRFRLWAPGEKRLSLELSGRQTPMEPGGDGWFELVADGVEPGMPYSFVLDDGMKVPDPASRAQQGDVHGPSLLVDPTSFSWKNPAWRGRAWEEAVIYELHVGTFTRQGTFAAARERLGHLRQLGVTAVELMPVAQFAGKRGWGYDGVLLYAPHRAYGSPDDLKALVDAAHAEGLMMILDVVYNHFGPEGNYLHRYAPDFFHPELQTPWGAAIAYDRQPVRGFFIENALYWLEEYQFDGLRFDAIDNIRDENSDPELMIEIAERIRAEFPERHVHLTTEDNRNATYLHERGADGRVVRHTAEWNDDVHNALHVIATGEDEGYYEDFADEPWEKLARALAEGFAYQGEPSRHCDGEPRGAPSAHLPPTAFIDFLQNHDQIGNRALGDRLAASTDPRTLELMTAMLILSPHIPMIFMGEEYGETRPFLFFTDFEGDLARAVRDGRRREFSHFSAFRGHEDEIPDPNAEETFERSRLDWSVLDTPEGRERLGRLRTLIEKRHAVLVPLLGSTGGNAGRVVEVADGLLAVDWRLGGRTYALRANFGTDARSVPALAGEVVHADPPGAIDGQNLMQPKSIVFALEPETRT